MEEWDVVNVKEYWPSQEMPCWVAKRIRLSDGIAIDHIFPKMIFSARSIEYDIPESESDILLDMVLHEPFNLDPYLDEMVNGGDPAIKVGLTNPSPINYLSVRIGDEVGVTCHTADDLSSGRKAHLLRIDDSKNNRGVVRCSKPAILKSILGYRESAVTSAYIEDEFRGLRSEFQRVIIAQKAIKRGNDNAGRSYQSPRQDAGGDRSTPSGSPHERCFGGGIGREAQGI